MADKFSKTHPWRIRLLRDVETRISSFMITLQAGERMCRTKGEATAFRDTMTAEHGTDTVSDVYRAGGGN
jgi:hypothetical protein